MQSGRTTVKCVKRKPNKSGGGPDKVDLLVLIDLVRPCDMCDMCEVYDMCDMAMSNVFFLE